MGDAAEFFAQQDTALIVRVPEAEPVVAAWRLEHDSSASLGVPAHVTILFPWMPNGRIDDDTLDALRGLFRGFEPFTADVAVVEDRDDVIWMRPEPDRPFRDLTAAVWERWPEFPPYEGQYDDVIPHLTIAEGEVDGLLDPIEASVTPHLPIRTRVTEAELIAFEAGQWGVRDVFSLGGPG